jgi:hypothetical protein
VFGEVKLPALALYVHAMTRADQVLTAGMEDLPEGLQERTGAEIHYRITAACWKEEGLAQLGSQDSRPKA